MGPRFAVTGKLLRRRSQAAEEPLASKWMSSGGYESISKQVFQRAKRYNVFPLEYDDARFFPRENLALATQCGFASVMDGNPIRAETQPAKLRLVVETARRVWV